MELTECQQSGAKWLSYFPFWRLFFCYIALGGSAMVWGATPPISPPPPSLSHGLDGTLLMQHSPRGGMSTELMKLLAAYKIYYKNLASIDDHIATMPTVDPESYVLYDQQVRGRTLLRNPNHYVVLIGERHWLPHPSSRSSRAVANCASSQLKLIREVMRLIRATLGTRAVVMEGTHGHEDAREHSERTGAAIPPTPRMRPRSVGLIIEPPLSGAWIESGPIDVTQSRDRIKDIFTGAVPPGCGAGLITELVDLLAKARLQVAVYSSMGEMGTKELRDYMPLLALDYMNAQLRDALSETEPMPVKTVVDDALKEIAEIVPGGLFDEESRRKMQEVVESWTQRFNEATTVGQRHVVLEQFDDVLYRFMADIAPYQDESIRKQIIKCYLAHDVCLVLVGLGHATAINAAAHRPKGLTTPISPTAAIPSALPP